MYSWRWALSFSTFCWLLCSFFSSAITHTTGLSSARLGSCPWEPTPSLLIPHLTRP